MATTWIVLVNWNSGGDTIECLESLLRLESGDFAVVIVDNGSTDGSAERIASWARSPTAPFTSPVWSRLPFARAQHKSFTVIDAATPLPSPSADITLIRAGRNLGFAGANNLGMAFAKADSQAAWYWILNNDTVVAPDSLSIQVARMAADPAIGMLGARLMFYAEPDVVQGLAGGFLPMRGRGYHIGMGEMAGAMPSIAAVEAEMRYVLGASMFVRASLVDRIGAMEESYFLYFEELDWARRMPRDQRLAIAPDAIVWHKEGGSIGSSTRCRPSDTSLYYINASLLRFYWRHYRGRIAVAIARVLREALGLIARSDRAGARAIGRAAHDVLRGVHRQGRYGSAEFEAAPPPMSESLHVGIDGHVLTGRFQGTRTTLSGLLRALAPRIGKRRFTIYANDPAAARAMLGTDAFGYADLGGAGSIMRLLSVFPRLFQRDGVDLGVFQYMAPLTGRTIVFIHDILPLTHPHLFPLNVRLRTWIFFTMSIRRARLVIAVSNYTREAILRYYRLPPERLHTVLNGPSFPAEVYERGAEPAASRYILTVGRIEPRKNAALLAAAFRRAAVPGLRLVIAGSWDPEFPRGTLEGEGIEVREGLDDAALIELYRGASLFVYPSEAEGFGVPLLDATLFGLPVIASDRTALPEVAGDMAEYFDPTASDAAAVLAARIASHFSDRPVARPNPTQRAAQAKRLTWDQAAEAFLAAIDAAHDGARR